MPPLRIDPTQVGILLIDAQPLFWQGMSGESEPVLARIEHLLMLAGAFHLPLIATFEHPTGRKGWLPERLEAVFPAHGLRLCKHYFNAYAEEPIRRALNELPVSQIAVAGAETDVCVLQTVLGLLEGGYSVLLLEDCLFSSEPHPRPALERMVQAGAVPASYKTFYYELVRTVDRAAWPAGWPEALAALGERFLPPEALPPSG